MAMQQLRLERENEAHVDHVQKDIMLEEKLNRLENKVDSPADSVGKMAEKQTMDKVASNVIGAWYSYAGLLHIIVLSC